MVERDCRHGNADANEDPRIDAADELAGEVHGDEAAEAARRHGDTRGQHRIAEQILQQRRQQRHRREQHHAHDEHQKISHREIRVLEQPEADEGLTRRQRVNEENVSGGDGYAGLDPDLRRAEPILELTAIEENLQRADRETEGAEAEEVEARAARLRLAHISDEANGRQDADRHVDVEHPAPAVVVGQPAAEHRRQHGTEHHPLAPERHGATMPLGGIDVEQHGLRQRHQARPGETLQDPEQNDLIDRLRHAAQHGADGETDHRGHQHALAPEAPGEPARQRRHDGGGHDVGGQHPIHLVERCREIAADVRQRDVGDGRIHRLQHGGER